MRSSGKQLNSRPSPWVLAVLLSLAFSGCAKTELPLAAKPDKVAVEQSVPADAAKQHRDAGEWVSLFDGKSLGSWKTTDFGGQGGVAVEDGAIVLLRGGPMTGVTWTGKEWPQQNYEIELEARRVDGSDFFCGLTFAVGEDPCSLILGGWGGTVVGLSNLDGQDAANNNTTRVVSFKTGQWYKVRLRVTPKNLSAWIDGDQIVDANIEGQRIGIRSEVELSVPLGIATYQTTGAIRDIRYQQLSAAEITGESMREKTGEKQKSEPAKDEIRAESPLP